jgi:putative DNA primase/helicase
VKGLPFNEHGLRSSSRNYGLRALDSEVLILENAAEGTRNESLFKSAIKLGQLAAAGHLKDSMVRAGLESVIRAWPNQQKTLGTIESGLNRGLREQRGISAPSNGIEPPSGPAEEAISSRFLSV